MKVKIVRHSIRYDSTHMIKWLWKVITGKDMFFDTPLSSQGLLKAEEYGKLLVEPDFNPTKFYVSPYVRTQQTAFEIQKSFPNSEIVLEPLLGEFQAVFHQSLNSYPDGLPGNLHDIEFKFPESYLGLAGRCQYILNDIIDHNEDVIIVTHSETIRTLAIHFNLVYGANLNIKDIPYLCTLSFDVKDTNGCKKIDYESFKLNEGINLLDE